MNEILEFSRCKSVCASLLWAMLFGNGQKCICMGASLLFKLCFILEMDKYVRVRAIVALEMDRYVNVCALPLCVNRSLEMDRYVRVSAHPLCPNYSLERDIGQICKYVCATFVFKSRFGNRQICTCVRTSFAYELGREREIRKCYLLRFFAFFISYAVEVKTSLYSFTQR